MQPGQQITATLRLVKPLGKGGMGSVWIARHLGLGTHVAVKFMAKHIAEDAPFVERFRREAMAAAQIKSPHVAQVFDHGVTPDGIPYIVMELLEGELLGKRIKRVGPLSPRDTAMIITQVAKALTRAHQVGIVHRDIKPDNIFLAEADGETIVKVIDFGVAKQGEGDVGMTTTGSMVGTPLYMSPEQIFSAKHVDHRSDLWALAVVAYYAMLGRTPFSGDTLGALSIAVHTGVFTPPSQVNPAIPQTVDQWFQRALQREPANRFQSAREMAETLERAVSGTSWSAWTSTSLPVASLNPALGSSSAPGFGASTGPGAGGSTAPGMSNSGAQIASGTYPSVAQGSVALSAVTRTGPSGRYMAAIVVAATIASLTGAVGAILLFRSSGSAANAGAPSGGETASVSAVDPITPPTAPSAVTTAPTATATATETAPAPPPDASAAASADPAQKTTPRPGWRPPPQTTTTGKPTAKPAPTKDTIGF